MQKNKWSIAAIDGLLLALITIIVTLIQAVFETGTAINVILWVIKFGGSIGLLYYLIKDYSNGLETFTYKEGFNFGFVTCLLSSIICACYMFAHFAVIFPDSAAASLEQASAALGTGNTEAANMLAKFEANFPQVMFITSLIYDTLFGALASAIIANYTKKGDVFSDKSI